MLHAVQTRLLARRRCFFFFQAEDGIRDLTVTGVQTCALPIYAYERYDSTWRDRDPPPGPGADRVRVGFAKARSPPGDRSRRGLEARSLEATRRRHGPIHGEVSAAPHPRGDPWRGPKRTTRCTAGSFPLWWRPYRSWCCSACWPG